MLTLFPTADSELATTAPALPGSASFSGDPNGFSDPQGTGDTDFATAPMTQDTVLAGQPLLDLVASFTAPRVHLIGTLYDEGAEGDRRRISQFAINPELRSGVSTPSPVVPGLRYEMSRPASPWPTTCVRVTASCSASRRQTRTRSRPSRSTRTSRSPPGPTARSCASPVVTAPTLVDDNVPFSLGADDETSPATPAQPEERASVTPTLGAPERTPASVAYHEFEVAEEFDNDQLLVSAVPSMDAAIDLYLQRQQEDGTWSGDLASGASGSLAEESLRAAQPSPGRYRIEVHNWAGLPATRVDLTLTFLNSLGEPGPAGP